MHGLINFRRQSSKLLEIKIDEMKTSFEAVSSRMGINCPRMSTVTLYVSHRMSTVTVCVSHRMSTVTVYVSHRMSTVTVYVSHRRSFET
jgi:hypothetical protein